MEFYSTNLASLAADIWLPKMVTGLLSHPKRQFYTPKINGHLFYLYYKNFRWHLLFTETSRLVPLYIVRTPPFCSLQRIHSSWERSAWRAKRMSAWETSRFADKFQGDVACFTFMGAILFLITLSILRQKGWDTFIFLFLHRFTLLKTSLPLLLTVVLARRDIFPRNNIVSGREGDMER